MVTNINQCCVINGESGVSRVASQKRGGLARQTAVPLPSIRTELRSRTQAAAGTVGLPHWFSHCNQLLRGCRLPCAQAGKTETAKIFVRSIVQLAKSKHSKSSTHTSLEKSIVNMNCILEAFGNAKSSSNFNSSRFGQYLGLQLHSQYGIQVRQAAGPLLRLDAPVC